MPVTSATAQILSASETMISSRRVGTLVMVTGHMCLRMMPASSSVR